MSGAGATAEVILSIISKENECYRHAIRTTEENRQTRSTRAVTHSKGTGELNAKHWSDMSLITPYLENDLQISDSDVVSSQEGLLLVDDFVYTSISMEGGLDVFENSDGSICSSSTDGSSRG